MSLEDKLKKLKELETQNQEPDWQKYKEEWKNDVQNLYHIIMDKWFGSLKEKGLMSFAIIPMSKLEPYVGEYITSNLEIEVTGSKFFTLVPIAAITIDYNGKLEFYMRGNVLKKVSIMRNFNNEKAEWIVATSYDPKDHYPLTKESLERIIETWLS